MSEKRFWCLDEYKGETSPIVDVKFAPTNELRACQEALKELKEIGDYQAMRIRELDDMISLIEDEIDKKIVLLTDAEIECIQSDNKELYGKVKFSIQVLRELQGVIFE